MRKLVLCFALALSAVQLCAQVVPDAYYDSLLLALNKRKTVRATHMVKKKYFLKGINRKGVKVVEVANDNLLEHPVGIWQWFWPNGNLKEHVNFNMQGFPQGISNRYYEDGTLMCRVEYDPPQKDMYNDKRYEFYWDDYNRYETWYHTSGEYYSEGKYNGQNKEGRHKEVKTSGRMYIFDYQDGVQVLSMVVMPLKRAYQVTSFRPEYDIPLDTATLFHIPTAKLQKHNRPFTGTKTAYSYKLSKEEVETLGVDSFPARSDCHRTVQSRYANGFLKTQTIFSKANKLLGKWTYQYNEQGDTTEASYEAANGNHIRTVFTYEEDGQLVTRKNFDHLSKLQEESVWKLDNQGRLQEYRTMDNTKEYTYDANGHLQQILVTQEGDEYRMQASSDASGNVLSLKGDRNITYFYDLFGRLALKQVHQPKSAIWVEYVYSD